MAKKVILTDVDNEQILPLTVTSQVKTDDGSKTVATQITEINSNITSLNNELDKCAKTDINNNFSSGQTINGDLWVNGYLNINTKDFSSQNNSAIVIDSYKSGATWYRIWSDGWKECGSYVAINGTSLTITLPITFSDTNYTFVTSEWETTSTDTDGVDFGFMFSDKTVNTVRVSKASARYILYYACGF